MRCLSSIVSADIIMDGIIAQAHGAGAGLALSTTARRLSPVLGRALDLFEVLLIVSVVPLAVLASGLYGWVRSLNS